jgi:hypothetical protein
MTMIRNPGNSAPERASNMNMRPLLALVLLATSLPLRAEDQEPPFSYLFLNAAFTRDRDRSADVISNGFSLGGSVDLSESAFLSAGYSHGETGVFRLGASTGEVEDDGFSVGVGGHRSLTRRTDLTSSLSYVQSRTRIREVGSPESEDRREGAAASLGLRHLIHPWVEVSAGPSYSFIAGQRGWDLSAGLGFLMTRKVWMDVDYYNSGGEDSDGWSMGLRTVLGGD